MLPRRFALIRHVDYTGGAGTGVIAYGVAFDDGQVVLRWSSAHRATSVLDSVEDLVAAHGHGETTSIEWIDAPAGKADAPAQQQGGRRARRPTQPGDELPATEIPQAPEPPAPAHPEPPDVRPAPQAPAAPAEPAARPAAHTPQTPAPPPAAAGSTTAPVPTAPAASIPPATPAHPTPPVAVPPVEQPTNPNGQSPPVPAAPPHGQPVPETPAPVKPATHAFPSPTSNGAIHASSTAEPADTAVPGPAASSATDPSAADPKPARAADTKSRADRNGDPRARDRRTDIVDSPTAGRDADDERRARHEAIATQPMDADLPEDREQRRPRRAAAPPHESPRSIFEEAEEPARPDPRSAGSNGRGRAHDSNDSADTSPERVDSDGFFPPGQQHLDTVTGLLDLPAGLNKRGRGQGTAEQDAIASRRNGRHRGE